MKNYWLVIVILCVSGCKFESNEANGKYNAQITDPVTNAIKEVNQQAFLIQAKAESRAKDAALQAEIARIEARNSEVVKLWVRSKDTKTCMKILKTDVINEEVINCNKDRYVSMRSDEVEDFKKEYGL